MKTQCILFVIALLSSPALGYKIKRQTNEQNTDLNDRPTVSSALGTCITNCPVTPEYNPVCGSDSITYTNPGRLSCAQICGVNVTLARTAPCPPSTQAPSQ